MALVFPAWVFGTFIVSYHSSRNLLLKHRDVSGDSIASLETSLLGELGAKPNIRFPWDVAGMVVISAFFFALGPISGHHVHLRYHFGFVLGGLGVLISLVLLNEWRRDQRCVTVHHATIQPPTDSG